MQNKLAFFLFAFPVLLLAVIAIGYQSIPDMEHAINHRRHAEEMKLLALQEAAANACYEAKAKKLGIENRKSRQGKRLYVDCYRLAIKNIPHL